MWDVIELISEHRLSINSFALNMSQNENIWAKLFKASLA